MLRKTTEELQGCSPSCSDHIPRPGRAGWLSCIATLLLLSLASSGWHFVCSVLFWLLAGLSFPLTLLTKKNAFAVSLAGVVRQGLKPGMQGLKPGFPSSSSSGVLGGGPAAETAPCTQAEFQNSASVSLLLYCFFMVPVLTEKTCLSAAVFFFSFSFLLSHCTTHQSFVSFTFWSLTWLSCSFLLFSCTQCSSTPSKHSCSAAPMVSLWDQRERGTL